MNDQQWEKAVIRACASEKWFPPPAVLRKYGTEETRHNLTQEAIRAYEMVEARAFDGAALFDREWGRAVQEAVAAAGSWRWCSPDEEPWRRKRFIEAYVAAVEENQAPRLPSPEHLAELKAAKEPKQLW